MGGTATFVVLVLVVAAFAFLRKTTPRVPGSALDMRTKRISEVGRRPDGTLGCPVCGGSQFTAKRSGGSMALLGILAPKTMVRCVTCGTTFRRG